MAVLDPRWCAISGARPTWRIRTRYRRYDFVNTNGEPDFAYYHAARTLPLLSHFLGDLRAEAARLASGQATGAEPVPYASRKVRDEQAERIKKAKDLTEEDRAMLLAHVALTPYLQATYPAPAPN